LGIGAEKEGRGNVDEQEEEEEKVEARENKSHLAWGFWLNEDQTR
jgi:hypothetical protein